MEMLILKERRIIHTPQWLGILWYSLYWVFIESSTKKQTLTQDLEIGWDKLNMVEPL